MNEDRRRLTKKERDHENKRINELHDQGVSIDGLAQRFGYSKAQILSCIRRYREKMRR